MYHPYLNRSNRYFTFFHNPKIRILFSHFQGIGILEISDIKQGGGIDFFPDLLFIRGDNNRFFNI